MLISSMYLKSLMILNIGSLIKSWFIDSHTEMSNPKVVLKIALDPRVKEKQRDRNIFLSSTFYSLYM